MKITCRICKIQQGEFFTLDSEVSINDKDEQLLEVYNKCLQLEAKLQDSLPQVLCCTCFEKLRELFEFQLKASKSDLELRQSLGENSHKIIKNEVSYDLEPEFVENVIEEQDMLLPDHKEFIATDDNNGEEQYSEIYDFDAHLNEEEDQEEKSICSLEKQDETDSIIDNEEDEEDVEDTDIVFELYSKNDAFIEKYQAYDSQESYDSKDVAKIDQQDSKEFLEDSDISQIYTQESLQNKDISKICPQSSQELLKDPLTDKVSSIIYPQNSQELLKDNDISTLYSQDPFKDNDISIIYPQHSQDLLKDNDISKMYTQESFKDRNISEIYPQNSQELLKDNDITEMFNQESLKDRNISENYPQNSQEMFNDKEISKINHQVELMEINSIANIINPIEYNNINSITDLNDTIPTNLPTHPASIEITRLQLPVGENNVMKRATLENLVETRKWSCPDCGRKYLTEEKLEQHRKQHLTSENCECEVCGKYL